MRDPQAKNPEHAETLRKQGIEVVKLDVSIDASVDRAVKEERREPDSLVCSMLRRPALDLVRRYS